MKTDIGRWTSKPMKTGRLLAIDAYSLLSRGHPMVAMVELDVTVATERLERLRREGARVSMFAFVAHAIAVALHENPALNVIRHGREVVCFDDVDVAVPLELDHAGGPPTRLVLRHADTKSAAELYAEIDAARHSRAHGVLSMRDPISPALTALAERLPAAVRRLVMRRMIFDPLSAKRYAGTTSLTSVAKMATLPGFVLPLTGTPQATLFALGATVDKPVVRGGKVVPAKVISLTATFDHDVVDGAPAARLIQRLQELIETGAGLEPVAAVA